MQFKKRMRCPGLEPGSPAWEADIIPLDQQRLLKVTVMLFRIKYPKVLERSYTLLTIES